MQYVVVEVFKGVAQTHYGPFPTHDSALDFVDHMNMRLEVRNHPYAESFAYNVHQLQGVV